MDILTVIERLRVDTFNIEQFRELTRQCPKAAEYNRVITSVLHNYITGVAKGMVEYGVENALDAWRKLYHHYLPLAEDLQQLLIQELCSLNPVIEGNIDSLFNKVERITEFYTLAGRAGDAISEKWIKAAVLRNFHKQLTRELALQLRDAKTVTDVRNIINIYMHDHLAGMFRGQTGPMLCVAEDSKTENENRKGDSTEKNADRDTKQQDADNKQNANENWQGEGDLHATTKGVGKGEKGGKGYGECWHCGEWGHPRRECPHVNEPGKAKGALGAFNGGKKGGKGKGKHGKGGKGQGKGTWGKRYNYQYRSPGKGLRKGLNQLQDDWYSAWGTEFAGDYKYYEDDCEDWSYGGGLGNIMMMLEGRGN